FFFFSSRRRHTRFSRDWSSDVCSSDLTGFLLPGEVVGIDGFVNTTQLSNAIALEDTEVCVARIEDMDRVAAHVPALQHQLRRLRSEERRVGKECRARRWACDENKKSRR